MKIKELFENDIPFKGKIRINVKFGKDGYNPNISLDYLENALTKQLSKNYKNFTIDTLDLNNFLRFEFTNISIDTVINKSYIEDLQDFIMISLKQLNFIKRINKDNINAYLEFNKIPDHPVTCPNNVLSVFIDADQEISFENIDKNILNCKKLLINNNIVKSNILGVLKMKDTKVKFIGSSKPWADIVQSYLDSDRNILKCQRELIQNGFKDYAKL